MITIFKAGIRRNYLTVCVYVRLKCSSLLSPEGEILSSGQPECCSGHKKANDLQFVVSYACVCIFVYVREFVCVFMYMYLEPWRRLG